MTFKTAGHPEYFHGHGHNHSGFPKPYLFVIGFPQNGAILYLVSQNLELVSIGFCTGFKLNHCQTPTRKNWKDPRNTPRGMAKKIQKAPGGERRTPRRMAEIISLCQTVPRCLILYFKFGLRSNKSF